MRSVVVIPGQPPHWVSDHARHLAQRLTRTGRVLVAFTHEPTDDSSLPGRPLNGSVLGHSLEGFPIWTGRVASALGLRRSSKVTVIVLWPGASHLLSLGAGIGARLRGERVVLDIAEAGPARPSIVSRGARYLLGKMSSESVEGAQRSQGPEDARGTILALCGNDAAFARLIMQTFDGMSDAAARRWSLHLQVDQGIDVSRDASRRADQVRVIHDELHASDLRSADVLLAEFGRPYEDLVHQSVLTGGAGVVVGHPVARRVARCHDGVWLALPTSANILVALERSTRDILDRPGTVAELRRHAGRVIELAEQAAAA